jgi:hypothetical protein
VPQESVPPQPSDGVPQFAASESHVAGEHPHTFAVPPPPQVSSPEQVPQSSIPPHPSDGVPQFAASESHVLGEQPHAFAVPAPPQVSLPEHLPQWSVLPQPSEIAPHSAPRSAQVEALHPHWFGWLAPQTSVPVHLPQWSVLPQPSESGPQSAPSSSHVFGTQTHGPQFDDSPADSQVLTPPSTHGAVWPTWLQAPPGVALTAPVSRPLSVTCRVGALDDELALPASATAWSTPLSTGWSPVVESEDPLHPTRTRTAPARTALLGFIAAA